MESSGAFYRILVIDDTPEIHEDFRKILCSERRVGSKLETAEAALFGTADALGKQSKFEVDSAFQAEHGLAKVYHAIQEGRPYAMAFVDVRMPPGWTGIDVAPKLWFADPDLQIVICTAYSDFSWETMFFRIGTASRMFILKKPFDRMEVLQLAHNLTERWQLARKDRAPKNPEGGPSAQTALADKMTQEFHTEFFRLAPDQRKPEA